MEAIITIVGFLGAGKTTLLGQLLNRYVEQGWNPFLILNDYENANLDAQQFNALLSEEQIKALSGSCICCSGIAELRESVNRIPEREKGITLIEANGTSDAVELMSFLGVGLSERFLPPIQISVVDVKNWQKRLEHNELEANQVQVSSLIILTHLDDVDEMRKASVIESIRRLNSSAEIVTADELDIEALVSLDPSTNSAKAFDHHKAHWASCSTDLPDLPDQASIHTLCDQLPSSIVRIKGCTRVSGEKGYSYFERLPDGTVNIKPFYGEPITGAKLLSIGPGSDIAVLDAAIKTAVACK